MKFLDLVTYSYAVKMREFEFEAIANHKEGYQYTDDQMAAINEV